MLNSLDDAKSYPDGVVYLEGDSGGTIYVVCPASLVQCSEDTLRALLLDLDGIVWPGNEEELRRALEKGPISWPDSPPLTSSVNFVRAALGENIGGGMEGDGSRMASGSIGGSVS